MTDQHLPRGRRCLKIPESLTISWNIFVKQAGASLWVAWDIEPDAPPDAMTMVERFFVVDELAQQVFDPAVQYTWVEREEMSNVSSSPIVRHTDGIQEKAKLHALLHREKLLFNREWEVPVH